MFTKNKVCQLQLVVYLLLFTNSQFKNWVEYSQILLLMIIHRLRTPHLKPPLMAKDSFVQSGHPVQNIQCKTLQSYYKIIVLTISVGVYYFESDHNILGLLYGAKVLG